MPFIHDDFILQSQAAQRLYHEYAEGLPIIDYHTHLSQQEVSTDKHWNNLFEIWLGGDHYKWRAMRSNGIAEDFCTGTADEYDKFLAYCRTVPAALRNPLYHWSHLELKRYFGIDTLISEKTAPDIWATANAQIVAPDFSAKTILNRFHVAVVCTTDDPADALDHHLQIAASGLPTRILPTYRPDKALTVDNPDVFNPWCDKLAAAAGIDCNSFASLVDALRKRHHDFHAAGCRLSDHGLEHCYSVPATSAELSAIFAKVRSGNAASLEEKEKFASAIMLAVGQWDAEIGWTMQLHLGPMRNNSSRLFQSKGPDIGCDSVGDTPQAFALSRFLDSLDRDNRLPRTIIYNINPADNYVLASMIGNFQDGTIPGKIQFGSGWWFLDQKEGMEWQINALSNLGLLSRFVGMLTDSRSFLSYPRHEYFRRILCNLLGKDMKAGEIPPDFDLVGDMVRNICYYNAKQFFGLDIHPSFA